MCLKGLAGLPFTVVYVLTERRDSVKAGCRVQIPPEVPRVIPAKFCRGSMAWGVARAATCISWELLSVEQPVCACIELCGCRWWTCMLAGWGILKD